ncbi:MAG: hypothetical protein AAB641_00590 [Patescibacteria group bacterium]
MKKSIDWGMILPLLWFIALIALGLAAMGRGLVKNEMYVYNVSAPISWGAVLTHFAIIYFLVVEAFLSCQVAREIAGTR